MTILYLLAHYKYVILNYPPGQATTIESST